MFSDLMSALNDACLEVFGGEVQPTYTPPGGSPQSITVISYEPSIDEATAPGRYTLIFAKLSSFSVAPVEGGTVVMSSITYKVVDVSADEGGGVELKLRKAG